MHTLSPEIEMTLAVVGYSERGTTNPFHCVTEESQKERALVESDFLDNYGNIAIETADWFILHGNQSYLSLQNRMTGIVMACK